MKKIILSALALILAASMCLSLYGCGSAASTDALDDNLEYAKEKVQDYAEWQAKYESEFYDEVYAKASLAAIAYNSDFDDEKLQSLARYLFVDTLMITDDKGEVVASFPAENKGKNIGDIEGMDKYKAILKWINPRLCSDPAPVEGSDEYTMDAGVQRIDEMGVVIVGFTTDGYDKTIGADLAQQCGNNVIVALDGNVISSTVDGVERGKALSDYGIKDTSGESFTFKAGKTEFTAKSDKVGSFNVICAQKS